MERPHNRKRHQACEPSHQDDSAAYGRKRQRTDESSHQINHPTKEPSWQYPPEFWDGLSKTPLIHSAVKELERRTYTRPSYPSPPTELAQHFTRSTARQLARFARNGGPDLRHLRGYPPATTSHRPAGAMSSSSPSGATKSTDPTSKSGTTKTKSTTPYNRGFDQHLTDHGVNPIWKSRVSNLEDIRAALAVPRQSLSPSKFSEGAFKDFHGSNIHSKDEDDVRVNVMPTITGTRRTDHPSAMSTTFGNLEPLTDGTLAPAKPDIYYGSYPEELDRLIRDELASHIIPSTMLDKPMAPNFFVEVKGPDGNIAVARRQARYDGAIGSRAMHTLQNYGKDEPEYDGNAYTFTSTYHDGTLKMYAHSTTAPTTPEGRPEYHMMELEIFAMTRSRQNFVEGATAFRNARDLAKTHRDSFIQAANSRASQAREAAVQADITQSHGYEISTSDKPHEPVPAHDNALQEADDELQQLIVGTSHHDFQDGDKEAAASECFYVDDDSQEASQEPAASGDDPLTSVTSSSTSGVSAEPRRSKRLRQSSSLRSNTSGSGVSKSRTRPSTARRTMESSAVQNRTGSIGS
ncbi:hypothetical protein ONZ43_g1071 [Nemania bipapillata]|uniref:Uncharacterized protein n=1 Tax=Nemania bipapillata TaxID=110536 RepID=A0ACC2J5Y2_9PEZI|nr:hypothetical protein ONZ43_g1071 [Nemania bipapillata]